MNKEYFKIPLSKIAIVIAGQSPKSIYYSSVEGVPFLQGNRTFGNLYPSFDTFTKKVTKWAKKDDVLMSVRAPVGDLNYAPFDLCIGRGLASIRAKNGNNKFLYYALKYNINNLLRQGIGTTFDSVNKDIINEFELIIPRLDSDRTKVASLLSKLDSKIELNKRINSELESMSKTLYDYWFVQFDFPDEKGKPYKTSGGKMVWNEEMKREIPEGWGNGCFGKYAKLKGGFAFKSSWWIEKGLPVIKIKDINEDNTLSIENCSNVNPDKYDIAKNYEAFPGDVVIAMTGATVGKFGIVPRSKKSILVNQRVGLFNLSKSPILKLPFLINSLGQDYFRQTIFVIASGAAQPNISSDQIDAIPLVFPPTELIDLFNSKLSCFYKIILNNVELNRKLSELRDWLLPMLMNGQVRVGD